MILTFIPASAKLLPVISLLQTGSGMLSAYAGRCQAKSDFLSIAGALVLGALPTHAGTVAVNWGNEKQTMDGFGGQTWISATSLTDAQADLFFSTNGSLALAYVRTCNTPDGSYPDLVTLKKAAARGAKVFLVLQSPPASMKSTGDFNSGYLLANQYRAYATYIVNQINYLASEGVTVDILSVQNEPDWGTSSLGACVWTASQFQTFVRDNLGPTFVANGITTKIMLGELAFWFGHDLVSATLNDTNAVQYLSHVSGHAYNCPRATPYPLAIANGKRIWMSEINGGFTKRTTQDTNMWVWDPSIGDAMLWAYHIHDYGNIGHSVHYQRHVEFGVPDSCFGIRREFSIQLARAERRNVYRSVGRVQQCRACRGSGVRSQ